MEQKLFEFLNLPFWPVIGVAAFLSAVILLAGTWLMLVRRSIASRLVGFAMFSVGAAVLAPVILVIYDNLFLY